MGIKTFLAAFALCLMASAAYAQFSPVGGATPYSFSAPEAAIGAAGASSANSASGQQSCYQEPRGRGGVQLQCSYQQPPTAGKK